MVAVQYEFHNVMELIKMGHPEPARKVSGGPPGEFLHCSGACLC